MVVTDAKSVDFEQNTIGNDEKSKEIVDNSSLDRDKLKTTNIEDAEDQRGDEERLLHYSTLNILQ